MKEPPLTFQLVGLRGYRLLVNSNSTNILVREKKMKTCEYNYVPFCISRNFTILMFNVISCSLMTYRDEILRLVTSIDIFSKEASLRKWKI